MKTPPKPSACPRCGSSKCAGPESIGNDCEFERKYFNEQLREPAPPHSKSEMRRLEAQGIQHSEPSIQHNIQHKPDGGKVAETDFEARRDDAAEKHATHVGAKGSVDRNLVAQDFKAGADWARNNCPRCGDMFYDPRTIIKSEGQRAADWEDVAKRLERELAEAKLIISYRDEDIPVLRKTIGELRAEVEELTAQDLRHMIVLSEARAEVERLKSYIGECEYHMPEMKAERDRYRAALEYYAGSSFEAQDVAIDALEGKE